MASSFGGGYLAFQGAHSRLGPLEIFPGVVAGGIGLFPGFVAGAVSTGVTAHFGFTVVSGIAGWLTADSEV
ncbi:MAG: hypothetical protein U1E78_07730 [Gammaproteobacteria bacterium]